MCSFRSLEDLPISNAQSSAGSKKDQGCLDTIIKEALTAKSVKSGSQKRGVFWCCGKPLLGSYCALGHTFSDSFVLRHSVFFTPVILTAVPIDVVGLKFQAYL